MSLEYPGDVFWYDLPDDEAEEYEPDADGRGWAVAREPEPAWVKDVA